MTLADDIATAEGKRRYVRRLFATIAGRYDLITVVLSYGQDRGWKRRLIELAQARPGLRALDLATGTGDLAFGLADRGADVFGLDVTTRMIEIAVKKNTAAGRHVRFLVGDMLALPFPAASFDVVTVGYGLRNVPDLPAAIEEAARVVRPGGVFLSLDFNRPGNGAIRRLYLAYLTLVGGALGWVLHRDPDTYRYIPASLVTYPGGHAVAQMMAARGFSDAQHHRVLFGLMSIHHARRN